ncbi:helix-turn-helix domain-containing protein [Epilithonimonas hispanica]|nr:helix-turn-helix domain-containing protein [Epilithonimonas hispanica]
MNGQKTYEELEKTYENLNENDEKALRYVNIYLKKAKRESNYTELKQAYEDYSYHSSNKKSKLKYADSAIIASKKAGDNDLLSSAYLYKGSIYYFYDKDYQSALREYLTAYDYSKKGNDDYLKYKVIYQMGLVKSYLGYYNEAIEHFKDCIYYFEPRIKGNYHRYVIYNSTKGYLNSLHQIAVCYRNIKNYKKADSIITTGLRFSKFDDFPSEKAYLTKCKGISEYHYKKYNSAITLLQKSLPILNKDDDFYWSSVSNFYIGKSYLGLGKEDVAIKQFEKVDSIFDKRQFIVPELLENYNLLIKYYQKRKDSEKELEYSKKLLKADSILNRDFSYLSAKIHKDYDKQILEESKTKLENQNKWGLGTIIILTSLLVIVILLAWKYYNNGKKIKLNYLELEKKLQQNTSSASLSYEGISTYSKSVLSKEIFTDLQQRLENFENNNEFNEKGLSLILLAEKLNTNTSYLSQYINDTKEMNFNKYLSTLRINYITRLMYKDPLYLRLKIQSLADACGISSRQNFSDLFQEINGIRPTDFIKQRKKELEEQGNISAAIPSSES